MNSGHRAPSVPVHSLIYIGSPRFDGIGLLNLEAQKRQKLGPVTFLDGIAPGAYPEIKNFDRVDHLGWKMIRRGQFLRMLEPGSYDYVYLQQLVAHSHPHDDPRTDDILDLAIADHIVCNNLSEIQASAYRQTHRQKYSDFVRRSRSAIEQLLIDRTISEVVIFNGRNTISRVLADVAKTRGIAVRWLEYFGKRNALMTYISSPVDIFDLDAMSDHVLDRYRTCDDPAKDRIAEACLADRVQQGDPLLASWGVDFSTPRSSQRRGGRKIAAFFFSSEDEYPAFKKSRFGLQPPNEQYRAFASICEQAIAKGLHPNYTFIVKLHPRYAVEVEKLGPAQRLWADALDRARSLGIDIEIADTLSSAYRIIDDADIVLSYGSTAWEATYLGKPAVLMGPNYFATHGCTHIANTITDVVAYLEEIPAAMPRENCYPYAWAWRELGHCCADFTVSPLALIPQVITRMMRNRFRTPDHDLA